MNLPRIPTRILGAIPLALVLAGGGFFPSPLGRGQDTGVSAKARQLYTCGMHPAILKDQPGNCPICGMKLTPIRNRTAATRPSRKVKFYKSTMMPGEVSPNPGKDSMGMDLVPVYEDAAASTAIAIDPVTIQNMGLRTAPVSRGPLRRLIRTVGVIDYDETALAEVTTKFKGWIEKLYVDATGKQVHRGEPLFEIYSPELYTAQTEYLLALGDDAGASPAGAEGLRLSAQLKLKYFDISAEQIADLERTRQPKKTLRVNAPIDGFVVEKMVVQGQMVDAGMKLYRLADLALVWVQAEVYEQDLPFVQLGQEATVSLSYLPDRKFRGRVTYLYPTVDEKTRTAKVRMEFHNPGYFLKPGMFATVELHSELEPAAVLAPDSAILRSGERNTVFVALEGGRFEPRSVTLGPRSEDHQYQILSGLDAGERVVTSGQFMLDSESQLREAIQKMIEPGQTPERESRPGAEPPDRQGPDTALPLNATIPPCPAKYICPMPEHVSIEYEHPGKCPICGMTLVPVSPDTLRALPPASQPWYYTCPMPEHSDVRADKPGKCPRCGMTLIPVMKPPTPGKGMPASAPSPAMASPLPAPVALAPATLYTCPMAAHADVVSDHPGKCPKCEMALVPTGTVPHGKTAERNWQKRIPTRP